MADGVLGNKAHKLFGKPLESLDATEQRVLAGIVARDPVSRDAGKVADKEADFGARMSDRVAAVGGSWRFIGAFMFVLLSWMLLNSDVLTRWGMAFDPYPYIFLNLMLSMVAAVQAPIIMMSQNRQADKDRVSARLDYEVNLRAELEILRVHEKIDELIIARLDAILARLPDAPKPVAAAGR